jgi:acetyl-CoA decarbonylase/synthase complex subunit delta
LPAVSEAAKGKNCLIGEAEQDNYKTLTASCLADGHNIIAQSPIDVNIAKQLNILISDMGLPIERIVINPTVGGLGYGMEYSYSVMERIRLAALGGDNMIASPFIGFVGYEAWRAKEAKSDDAEHDIWGAQENRGPAWEIATAVCLLQAGLDIAVLRHPRAVAVVKNYITKILEA